jgi:chemotaxis protein methyltransferase CheR
MISISFNECSMKTVNESEFQLIKRLIYHQTGIFLNDHKKTMVANRLRNRLNTLGIDNYKRYYDYVTKEPAGRRELAECINCLTTNETYFFRHREQIEYLVENILPELRNQYKPDQKIRIWSVGCSSGEEPYSIAILLDKKLKQKQWDQIEIIASDINKTMIDRARQGIYNTYALQQMPKYDQDKYFQEDTKTGQYHIIQKIKDRVHFHQHNILDIFRHGLFDVIICRNVFIYFNKESKERALQKILYHLKPKGFLIIGFAESLIDHKLDFTYIKPTIYRRSEK